MPFGLVACAGCVLSISWLDLWIPMYMQALAASEKANPMYMSNEDFAAEEEGGGYLDVAAEGEGSGYLDVAATEEEE